MFDNTENPDKRRPHKTDSKQSSLEKILVNSKFTIVLRP